MLLDSQLLVRDFNLRNTPQLGMTSARENACKMKRSMTVMFIKQRNRTTKNLRQSNERFLKPHACDGQLVGNIPQ